MGAVDPITTTAVVVPRLGGPDVLEVRSSWEVPAPGPGEVRVRVDAAGISFADLLVMQGVHPERRKPPFVPQLRSQDVCSPVVAEGIRGQRKRYSGFPKRSSHRRRPRSANDRISARSASENLGSDSKSITGSSPH
ncbi:MAG: hypothetical protein OEV40_08415 [Acidimicrobiia bacterium]|nr:hypothetical protein [Acidimicrobiia bacterium]